MSSNTLALSQKEVSLSGSCVARTALPWWEQCILYQVYTRSFRDANGDGIGDLGGIIEKLPYLQEVLGINALWLNPIYPSPWVDGGYDICNYTDVDQVYGGLEAFKALLSACHSRGMFLIMDFVPNHSSDRHPWFLESRANRINPKADWYVWRDASLDGSPPNNWVSYFGKSAWEWDAGRSQYYLHLFAKEQPDLNWRNPEVVQEMLAAMRFWLDLGVDGFRIDVIYMLYKDLELRNDTPDPSWHPGLPTSCMNLRDHSEGLIETLELIAQMRQLVSGYSGDRLLLGEMNHTYEPSRLALYYGEKHDGLHMPFNFGLILRNFTADVVSSYVLTYEAALPPGAWPNWVFGNHDQKRLASRVGPTKARLAMMLLLTLRGTPIIYYGEEIGMSQVNLPKDCWGDPMGTNEPDVADSREGARTPMQWSRDDYSGFSSVTPWLPVSNDFTSCNVESQLGQEGSMLSFTRKLVGLRKRSAALMQGRFRAVFFLMPDVFAYLRLIGECDTKNSTDDVSHDENTSYRHETLLVVLNFSNEERNLDFSSAEIRSAIWGDRRKDRVLEVLTSTHLEAARPASVIDVEQCPLVHLEPNEGIIFEVRG